MVEIKEEFCEVMTLASAYIYHKDLNIDFVMGNGEVSQLWINGTLEWDKEKCPEVAATTKRGKRNNPI